eukprot:TRINITY_DN614_c0_g1_i2.p1 TRINITY_DN614_c0_g1~~TRINITY_DN614_c0_g1_i2.p1  ORF type:complete len:558 (+),score=183.41 TRINITY_DN614_c0_g1_i2:51-1724(+)
MDLNTLFNHIQQNSVAMAIELCSKLTTDALNVPVRGQTVLHLATEKGLNGIVKTLIDKGVDLNLRRAEDNGTALILATMYSHHDVFNSLLEAKADITRQDSSGANALHWAVQNGLIEISKTLIEHKIDLGAQAKFNATPLHLASRIGNEEIVKLLIAYKAPLNAATTKSSTSLHISCMKGHDKISKFLINSGCSVNLQTDKGLAPLHYTANSGNKEITVHLIKHGANIGIKDNNGNTPLNTANMKGHSNITVLLTDLQKNGSYEENVKYPIESVKAVTIYPFTKQIFGNKTTIKDLHFQPNEIVSDLQQEKSGWWKGSLNGKNGNFPHNFVSNEIVDKVKVTKKYIARREDEINILPGEIIEVYQIKDNGWSRGIKKSSLDCGLFPTSFTSHHNEIYTVVNNSPNNNNNNNVSKIGVNPGMIGAGIPTGLKSINKPKQKKPKSISFVGGYTGVTKPNIMPAKLTAPPAYQKKNQGGLFDDVDDLLAKNDGGNLSHVSPRKYFKQAKVLYDYSAQHQGDLPLTTGSIIKVTKQDENGWWEGEHLGRSGIFPANYVELI